MQDRTLILHGETHCMKNAGLFRDWVQHTIYTTLSSYMMCSRTIIQFGIPRGVISENENFGSNEEFLRDRSVDVTVMNVPEMIDYFDGCIKANPDIWNGDIGC